MIDIIIFLKEKSKHVVNLVLFIMYLKSWNINTVAGAIMKSLFDLKY